MKKATCTLLFFLLICWASTAQDTVFNASKFGIRSDGITLNTRSIQKAIDWISEQGGGTLRFWVGRYLTGSIHLRSNVNLDLQEGAILVGSTNPYDYDKVAGCYALVIAEKEHNIRISGKGCIVGNGRELANNFTQAVYDGILKDPLKYDRVGGRARLVYFRECQNIRISGIWLKDDAICLKSHSRDHLCQNVEVRNCVARSSASGIKLGTFGLGGFKNIRIIHNKVYDTHRSAITIQSVDGGICENILVDSLYAVHTSNPFYLVVGERRGRRSSMRDVTIRNLYCEVPDGKADAGYEYEGPVEDLPRNPSPSSIIGLKGNYIENVVLENITLSYPGGGDTNVACLRSNELSKVPEMPDAYPEFSQHKELPAWGIYVRHARNVLLKNIKLTARKSDYREAVIFDDAPECQMQNCKVDD